MQIIWKPLYYAEPTEAHTTFPSIHAHSIHAPILNRDFFSSQYKKDHHFERNGYEHIMVRQIWLKSII